MGAFTVLSERSSPFPSRPWVLSYSDTPVSK